MVDINKVGMLIYVIRGRQVMLDRDLAELYGVETRIVNRAVRRNAARFPDDFMFQLTAVETGNWKSQFGISNPSIRMGVRYRPLAFTEHGIAMLSGVLNSERAIRVNIEIMRVFIGMRRVLGANRKLAERVRTAEGRLDEHEGWIESLYEQIDALVKPSGGPRRNIGFLKEKPG